MKETETNRNDQSQLMILADQSRLDRIEAFLVELKMLVQESTLSQGAIGKYVSEEQAKKILGKSTTWLWEQRKSGSIGFSKIGSTNYYLLERFGKPVK